MKWTVGTKIASAFGLVVIAMAIIGVSSYGAINRQNADVHWQIHSNHVVSQLQEVLFQLTNAETGQRGYVITGNESFLEPYNNSVSTINTMLESLLKDIADNPEQVPRGETLSQLVKRKMAHVAEVIALRREKGFGAAAKAVLTDQGKTEMDDIRALVAQMSAAETTLLDQRTAATQASTAGTRIIVVGGISLASLLLIVFGVFLTLNLARPLRTLAKTAARIALGDLTMLVDGGRRQDEVGVLFQRFSQMSQALQSLAQVAQKIAEGDLTVKVQPLSNADVLGNSFARMIENLRTLTNDIADSVSLIVSSASEIVATTVQIATSSAETATAINETTTTVDEVKQAAQLSSEKARTVTDSAQHVVEISQNGLKAVEETGEAMSQIRNQMTSIAHTIAGLSEQSQAIAEIIVSVADLADQSNLLAVNAAIEAARAGEAGKGFTVVAQEIKALADQSKQATTQVRALLNEIQRATGAAVSAAEQGTKVVELGVHQAAQTGDAIQLLAESCEGSAQSSFQIAASSQQQVVGVDQISTAMKNINQASMETAAGMRQSEVAAQNLNDLGRRLQILVSQFKL